jgi:hypothetical protein
MFARMTNLKEQLCIRVTELVQLPKEHQMIKTPFGKQAMNRTQTFEWFAKFKHRLDLC